MKQLVIGDIHGCYAELQDLLDKAALTQGDEIIALGDLVDRGPDSPGVVQFFRTTPQARAIMGNHERKHVRSYQGKTQPALSQLIARWQFGDDYDDAIAYMEKLPRYLELPDALLVHGFFEPGVPAANQRENVIVGVVSGEKYLQANYDRHWMELYDGDKPLIVGHRNYNRYQPFIFEEHIYGLDTRCYEGGMLTALLLPEFRFIAVPSRKNYWAELKRMYGDDVKDE